MKEQMQAEFRAYERIISHLKKVLADTHIGTAKIRRIWMEARVCGPATFPRAADRLHERQGKQQKPVCVYLCSTRRNCFSERLLRCYKRKQAQAVSFRSLLFSSRRRCTSGCRKIICTTVLMGRLYRRSVIPTGFQMSGRKSSRGCGRD